MMYGATLSGLLELLLFWSALFISACLCLVAILLVLEPGGSGKSAKKFAVGSMACSALNGLLFLLLLWSGVFSPGHGTSWCLGVFAILFISAVIYWRSGNGAKP